MADIEVEKTLREIRERVRAEAAAGARGSVVVGPAATQTPADGDRLTPASDALLRLEANLATAERAWARLPPLMSNRTGWVARLELWVKRRIKRATHWYTWEQVNFNSAVYHALRDVHNALRDAHHGLRDAHAALAACQHQLARLEASLNSEAAAIRSEAASLSRSLTGLESKVADAESLRAEREATFWKEQAVLRAENEALRLELRERVEHALEEQRVSFRQLSLEASERAVMHDRSRRDLEARLGETLKAVNRES